MTPPTLAGGHQLCGTAQLYTQETQFYFKKKSHKPKTPPQTQKEKEKKRKPNHHKPKSSKFIFHLSIRIRKKKKEKESCLCPLPLHSSQVRIVGLMKNNKRQQQVLPLSCKRNALAFSGTWARAQTVLKDQKKEEQNDARSKLREMLIVKYWNVISWSNYLPQWEISYT